VLTTPEDIRDARLLRLLGEIIRPDIGASVTSGLRQQIMRPGFPWQALLELALGQGVLLPLIFALTTRSLSPPIPRFSKNSSHVSVRLKNVYALHLAHRTQEEQQLRELLVALKRASVAPLVLKGARYLVDPLGSWCEARPMADFDLLVLRSDIVRTQAALIAAGYRQLTDNAASYGSALSHHLAPLQHPDYPMPVEIHVDPLVPAARAIMNTQLAWTHARRAESFGAFVLPRAWHALHGLLHHEVQDRGHAQHKLGIKALWEWSMLAHAFTEDDWSMVRAHMHAAGMLDILDSWSVQSHWLFGLGAPWFSEISATARRHADITLRRAFRPYWLRRTGQVADQLRVSFARETLAGKYNVVPDEVSLSHAALNLLDLWRRHRGNVLRRLIGYRQQS
jgi:hypothetical protein